MWSFDVVPSRLNEVYWSNSLHDIKTYVMIKCQFELVQVNQNLENLMLVAGQIFGGGNKNSSSPKGKLVEHESSESALNAIGQVFGSGFITK